MIICVALIPVDSQVDSFFKVWDISIYLNISQMNNVTRKDTNNIEMLTQ